MAKTIEFAPQGGATGKICLQLPNTDATDLDFSRTSGATLKNENGVLEDVLPNIPRYTFEDDGCPVLLLEPQSTNLITYSSDFTQWTTQRANLTPNVITSPKGDLSGSLIVPTAVFGSHQIEKGISASPSGTYSIYIKADGYSAIRINSGSSGNGYAEFDTVTESVINSGGTYFEKAKITKEKDGWYRCQLTLSSGLSGNGLFIYVLNELNQQSYTADGTSGLYIWHGQLEELPYASSPIETDGAIETRTKDSASKTNLENYINSSEGTFYFYGKALADSDINRFISLSDDSSNNFLQIRINTTNVLQVRTFKGGSGLEIISSPTTNTLNYYKCAAVWSNTKLAMFVNGVKIDEKVVDNSYPTNTFNTLTFNNAVIGGSANYEGKVKEFWVDDTALTDQELIDLTTL